MAVGRRREERIRTYELAALVWQLTSEPLTEFELSEFLRCGAFPNPADKRLPYMPEVEAKVKEILDNGSRLIVS